MKYSEIFLIAVGSYFYLVILLRFLGKKEMSQLSILDLIVFLIISELMTMSIGDDRVTFLHSVLATLSIVCLDKLCSYLSSRYLSIKKLLEGNPTYIIYQGQVNQKKMKALNYSVNDLCHHLREEGIGSVSDVAFAILETDGHLSIIDKTEEHYVLPDSLVNDGVINDDSLKLIGKDQAWLYRELKKRHLRIEDIFYCVLEDDDLFVIKK